MREIDYQYWKNLQDERLDEYRQGLLSFFTREGRSAKIIRKVVNKRTYGKCLDVGCGVMVCPPYMRPSKVEWHGIDPLEGEKIRGFKFVQGVAEDIPYLNETFDGVLFSTSLDHVFNPQKAIKEGCRVLKPGGYLFIWGGVCWNNRRYKRWKAKPQPAFYDKHHLLAYRERDILDLVPLKLVKKITIWHNPLRYLKGYSREMIFIFQK